MAASNKTVESDASVDDFLARVEPAERAADTRALIDLMRQVSGLDPKMWGPSIIGFGSVHYRYDSGREGDTVAIGFSPRKTEFALYVGASTPNIAALLPGLGKHRTGKGCLYVKRLADVNSAVLANIVQTAWNNRIASAV
ncbi:DUF1801 domain-containing protein [Sphingomonas sp.]|uniref:DUF1801 domain-containing protein n=1 Tax=Sphingomonas sp. TaxID=28214 RepID=UPI00333E6D87